MGYHYNLTQLISLQVIDGDSVLFTMTLSSRSLRDAILQLTPLNRDLLGIGKCASNNRLTII